MAVDHILYQGEKWYQIADNAGDITANGRHWYAIPKQVTMPVGTTVYGLKFHIDKGVIHSSTTDPVTIIKPVTVDCIGADKTHYRILSLTDNIVQGEEDGESHYETCGYVDKNAVTPIWGVN